MDEEECHSAAYNWAAKRMGDLYGIGRIKDILRRKVQAWKLRVDSDPYAYEECLRYRAG